MYIQYTQPFYFNDQILSNVLFVKYSLKIHFSDLFRFDLFIFHTVYCCTCAVNSVYSHHNGRWLAIYTPKSLVTLQPVNQRGTSIHWNVHNIVNTAAIHSKFRTMNIRYVSIIHSMTSPNICGLNLLCNVLLIPNFVKNRLWPSN